MPIKVGRDNTLRWRRNLPLANPWVRLFDFSSTVSYLAHLFEDGNCEQFQPFIFDWYSTRHESIYLRGAEFSLMWFRYIRLLAHDAADEARRLPPDYHLRRECHKRIHILTESIGDDADIRSAFYSKRFATCTKRVRKTIKRIEKQCGHMLRDLAGELAVDISELDLSNFPDALDAVITSNDLKQLAREALADLVASAERARAAPCRVEMAAKTKKLRADIFVRRLPPPEVVECAKYLREQYALMRDGKRGKASRREMIAEHIRCEDTGFLERQLQPSRYGYLLEPVTPSSLATKESGQ